MTPKEMREAVAAMPGPLFEDGRRIVITNPDYLEGNGQPPHYSVVYGELPDTVRRGLVVIANHFDDYAARYEKMKAALNACVSIITTVIHPDGAPLVAVDALEAADKPLECRS